jgi:UDP-N-acetylglucosamine:LPS N-acetylglucosamine transferase
MRKVRVLFPEVEAGLGHIMPLRAVADTFEKKYGDQVEVVRINFFQDTDDKRLKRFGQMLIHEVKKYNKHPLIGYWATFNMKFWGITLSNWGTMQFKVPFSDIAGRDFMEKLDVDVVFSTHWATNYYAEHVRTRKPLTIMYCPDVQMNTLFMYNSDLYLISMKSGYDQALKEYKKKVNADNLKLVPFLIRNEAFSISMDKRANRIELGLPVDKFTILIAEGGYGIGKLQVLCEKLTKTHLPITVIAVTGKNKELADYLKTLPVNPEVTFVPLGYTDKMLKYQASADIFCGKSGNIIAEPTFFGVPSIITNFSTTIEQKIGAHYIDNVGSAIKEFDPDKVISLIEDFMNHPEKLKPYQDAAIKYHNNYGAEKTADIIFEAIKKKYPTMQIADKED